MSNIQEIETSVGTFMADRVEFYENGVVKSAEPEQQVFFSHETGLYIAYDNTPLKDEEHLPTLEFEPDVYKRQPLQSLGLPSPIILAWPCRRKPSDTP